jgi:hypothetical protein
MAKTGLAAAAKKAEQQETKVPDDREAAPQTPAASPGGHDELEKLRGILFGNLQHEQGQALARLESRIAAQSTKLRAELDEIVQRIENRIEELDTRSTRDHDDLREQLLSQSSLVNEAIEERSAQVTDLVDQGIRDLGHAKLDRQRFAEFVSGLKVHLDQESSAAAAPAPEPAVSHAAPAESPANGKANGGTVPRKPWHPASAS